MGVTSRRGKRVSGRVLGTFLALTLSQAMARARPAPPADEEGRPEAPGGSLVPGHLQAYKAWGHFEGRKRANGLVPGHPWPEILASNGESGLSSHSK